MSFFSTLLANRKKVIGLFLSTISSREVTHRYISNIERTNPTEIITSFCPFFCTELMIITDSLLCFTNLSEGNRLLSGSCKQRAQSIAKGACNIVICKGCLWNCITYGSFQQVTVLTAIMTRNGHHMAWMSSYLNIPVFIIQYRDKFFTAILTYSDINAPIIELQCHIQTASKTSKIGTQFIYYTGSHHHRQTMKQIICYTAIY